MNGLADASASALRGLREIGPEAVLLDTEGKPRTQSSTSFIRPEETGIATLAARKRTLGQIRCGAFRFRSTPASKEGKASPQVTHNYDPTLACGMRGTNIGHGGQGVDRSFAVGDLC